MPPKGNPSMTNNDNDAIMAALKGLEAKIDELSGVV